MPRAATTSDVFNAIAEPRRRRIIDLLARTGQQAVGDLVQELRLPQPAVSKHLGVLRRVRIVSVRRRGRSRVYRLNPEKLKPVHDWIANYQRFWTHQMARIKARAEAMARGEIPTPPISPAALAPALHPQKPQKETHP
jgi:DNA-binding transcriptional ArsR family regulator